eukprot:m.12039 g.12039  ORF g.12039 m.12039 type:complete len:794 (+) comp4575_c0_seq1:253-2634(+)
MEENLNPNVHRKTHLANRVDSSSMNLVTPVKRTKNTPLDTPISVAPHGGSHPPAHLHRQSSSSTLRSSLTERSGQPLVGLPLEAAQKGWLDSLGGGRSVPTNQASAGMTPGRGKQPTPHRSLTNETENTSVEMLLDLVMFMSEECKSEINRDKVGCRHFTSQYHQLVENISSRPRLKYSSFDVIKQIAEGSTAIVYLTTIRAAPGMPFVMKQIPKSQVLSHPKYCWQEREVMIKANMARQAESNASKSDYSRLSCLRYTFHDTHNVYFVTDYYPGGDLCGLLDKYEHFSEEMTKTYAAEIVLALEAVHKLGFVHRDLRPDNLVIDERGHLKLCDFGSCEETNELGYCAPACLVDLRLLPVGKLEYIAPEIFKGEMYSSAADVWALGVVIYEMLHGVGPFESRAQSEEMKRADTIQKINNFNPENLPTTVQIYQQEGEQKEKKISPEMMDLLQNLLCDQAKRLTLDDIKEHPVFEKLSWDLIKTYSWKAPFVPELSSPFDTSFFDYDGEDVPSSPQDSSFLTHQQSCTMGFQNSDNLIFLGFDYVCPRDDVELAVLSDSPMHSRKLRRRLSTDSRLYRSPLSRFQQESSTKEHAESHLRNQTEPPPQMTVSKADNTSQDNTNPVESQSSEESIEKQSNLESSDSSTGILDESLDDTEVIIQNEGSQVRFQTRAIYLDTASTGELSLMKTIVKSGEVDLEDSTATGLTALCLASLAGHVDVVQYLLDKGVDVHAQAIDGSTSLHLAVCEEHYDVVKLLLENNADAGVQNIDGETPLQQAEDSEQIFELVSRYARK